MTGTKWNAVDLPSFTGRTVVITRANSGLGLVTARELAHVGAQVVLAVRDVSRGKAAADALRGDVEVRQLDSRRNLASITSAHSL